MMVLDGTAETVFKETEVGLIPAEWDAVPLKRLCTVQKESFEPMENEAVPYVGLEHITPGNPRLTDWGLSSEVRSSKTRFYLGHILYGKLRPYLDKAALATFEGVCSTDIIVIDADDGVTTPDFLAHLLHTDAFLAFATSTMTGVNHPRTHWSSLKEYQVSLPPLPEQRRIAAVLNGIQEALAAQEDVIAEAREFKRSLMQRLFTYGPGPQPAETKLTEIGEIPAHWEVVETGDIFEIQLGKMLSQKAKQGVSSRPYLRNANVQWGYIDLHDVSEMDFSIREMVKFRLKRDDILICEGGEIGRTAIWEEQLSECYYQKAIHRLRPQDETLVSPRFFSYYMLFIFVVRPAKIVEGASSTIAHLPVAKLRSIPAVLPPYSEQIEVVCQLQAADDKIAVEEDRKGALQDLFKSALHQLMTGQIRLLSDEGVSL